MVFIAKIMLCFKFVAFKRQADPDINQGRI